MAEPNCTQCISGSIHAGMPIGKEEQIHGLNTYVTGNTSDPKAIIVMYSDVFGLLLPNNKLIADALGKSGEYLVYLPDFFQGDPVGLKMADILIPVDAAKQSTFSKYTGLLASAPSFVFWMGRHGFAATDKVCMDFLTSLRKATPDKKIGMVGFCWGGRYALRAGLKSNAISLTEGAEKTPLVDAIVALHPSNLVLPTDVEGLLVPVSYGWGEEDSLVKIETMGQVKEVEKKDGGKIEMHHQVYRPGRHGFAVRGNPDDEAERKCLEDSITQTLGWFEKWL